MYKNFDLFEKASNQSSFFAFISIES